MNHWFSSFLTRSNPISQKYCMIENTSSGISYQLRDIYTTCRWCWNVKITSLVVKRVLVKLKDDHSVKHLCELQDNIWIFNVVGACVRVCAFCCLRSEVDIGNIVDPPFPLSIYKLCYICLTPLNVLQCYDIKTSLLSVPLKVVDV